MSETGLGDKRGLSAIFRPPAESSDVLACRVVDGSAGKGCGATHMGEHFAEGPLEAVSAEEIEKRWRSEVYVTQVEVTVG